MKKRKRIVFRSRGPWLFALAAVLAHVENILTCPPKLEG